MRQTEAKVRRLTRVIDIGRCHCAQDQWHGGIDDRPQVERILKRSGVRVRAVDQQQIGAGPFYGKGVDVATEIVCSSYGLAIGIDKPPSRTASHANRIEEKFLPGGRRKTIHGRLITAVGLSGYDITRRQFGSGTGIDHAE